MTPDAERVDAPTREVVSERIYDPDKKPRAVGPELVGFLSVHLEVSLRRSGKAVDLGLRPSLS
jgi:hypothetical protein